MPYIGTSPSNGVRRKHTYTATASQTSFSGAGAEGATLSYKDSNFVDVYQNGVKLGDADYTATSGTAIVLGTGATVSDLVVIVAYDVFSAADTVSKADGGQFDGNVTMAGTLGVTGIATFTDDIIIGDGKTIGSASDVDAMTIASNGQVTFSQTLIGTALDISGDIDVDGTTNLDVVDIDGAVDMASTLQVDGAITSSAGATITTADNSNNLTLISTDADASTGPNLVLQRDSASPADNDLSGTIKFIADNDAAEATDCVSIFSKIIDASNGSEDASLLINSIVGGSQISRFNITPLEIAINDDSVDLDFRVESNGNAGMLYVDGGNDRVGIGTTSPDALLVINKAAADHTSSAVTIRNSQDGGYGSILNFESAQTNGTILKAATIGTDGAENWASTANTSSNLKFSTMRDGTLTEHMRITKDGDLLLHKTSAVTSGAGTYFARSSNVSTMPIYLRFLKTYSGVRTATENYHDGTNVGGILFDNSSTTFSTSSDYRLKENVVTDWDATTRLKQLKPSRFNFKIDADKTVDGFLAHEVSSIVPEAVTGIKDELQVWEDGEKLPEGVSVGDNKLDDDGNTMPKYQGIDQSKLVPLLVKTIQELEARITALESA